MTIKIITIIVGLLIFLTIIGCNKEEIPTNTTITTNTIDEVENISFVDDVTQAQTNRMDELVAMEAMFVMNMTRSGSSASNYLNMSQLSYEGKEVVWVYQEHDEHPDGFSMTIVPCIITVDNKRYCERQNEIYNSRQLEE